MAVAKRTRAGRMSPQERKKQLTRFAIEAFATQGLGRANHGQVAKLAKVSVPTVFSYFPTREALVEEVLLEVERVFLSLVRQEASLKDASAFQKTLNLISNYMQLIDEDPDIVKVFLDWTTSFEEYLSNRLGEYLERFIPLFSRIVEDGKKHDGIDPHVDPADASLIIFSSANVIARIKFYSIETDLSRYVINLISSTLHLDETEEKHYLNEVEAIMHQ